MIVKEDGNVTIQVRTKGKLPRLPFRKLCERILGKRYELSVAIVGDSISRSYNRDLRGKDHPTNILSFALSPTSGEIILNPKKAAKDAPRFAMNETRFLLFLFIHGLLHLKGYEHGSTMERAEKKFLKEFS